MTDDKGQRQRVKVGILGLTPAPGAAVGQASSEGKVVVADMVDRQSLCARAARQGRRHRGGGSHRHQCQQLRGHDGEPAWHLAKVKGWTP